MNSVNRDNDNEVSVGSARFWRRIKLSALGLSGLTVAGMVGLMVLAAGKDEDIAGIIAPALLITLISGGIGIVAAFRQKRSLNNR